MHQLTGDYVKTSRFRGHRNIPGQVNFRRGDYRVQCYA